jgi:hypothetical protein
MNYVFTKEDMLLAIKPNVFTIGTITLPISKILVVVVANAKINIDTKIGINTKIGTSMKIDIKKLIFDFPNTLGEILVNSHASKCRT